ncbi:acyltransferase family protein [Microbacterium rhizophilus]|uniref:acyltransferase family protein n=1 Tax=Microbacterium rhizophilus TaxID=3138934 RepID=UPI0031F13338
MTDPGTRMAWIDVARGVAISLVVLFHTGMFTVPTGLAPGWWTDLNLAFALLRMPLFFLVSGLLAVGAVRRTWARLWSTRLAVLVWVFVLWTILRFLYYRVMPEPIDLNQSSWVDLVLSVVRPSNGLWFLFALAVFLVVGKAVDARAPRAVVLAVAGAASVALHSGFTTGNVAYDGILRYFVFFLAGLWFRDRIVRLVERMSTTSTVLLLGAFVAGIALRAVAGAVVDTITALPIASAGVLGALGASRALADRRLARPFAHLGGRTLQVYVTHVLLLSAMTTALMALPSGGLLAAVAPVLPVVLAIVAIVLSLLFARAAEALPLTALLYRAPAWFARTPVAV